MNDAPLDDWMRLAVDMAAEAGRITLATRDIVRTHRKADGSECTDVDLAVQEMMFRRIGERCPDHAIIGEEAVTGQPQPPNPADARFCWVLDPVDGTRNYVRRFPVVAASIALMDRGQPVIGVIRWHHTGQVFASVANGPATLNDVEMLASRRPLDCNLLVGAQLGATHATQSIVSPWLKRWAVRNLGATAVHLALVASGGLDLAYAKDCCVWDLAAGALLIERAGGLCTGPTGDAIFPVDPATCATTNYPFLAGGPTAHRMLLEDLATRTE